MRREPVYQEILQYSYQDYFEKFVVPYYQTIGIDLTQPEIRAKASDLRVYSAGLHSNPNIRLILNENDFLVTDDDLEWFQSTFRPDQLTVFKHGGHLGNLTLPALQKALLDAIEGLSPLQSQDSK